MQIAEETDGNTETSCDNHGNIEDTEGRYKLIRFTHSIADG